MEQKKFESMVSQHCYDEIVAKLKEQVGEEAFLYIFPAVKKALEEGSGKVREEILTGWLEIDSCRVCSECGKIMQEGWYNMGKYACSDECVMKQDGITKEEFDRYQIYKATIEAQLEEGQNIEDLSKEEIDQILESVLEDCDAYYTEWY